MRDSSFVNISQNGMIAANLDSQVRSSGRVYFLLAFLLPLNPSPISHQILTVNCQTVKLRKVTKEK